VTALPKPLEAAVWTEDRFRALIERSWDAIALFSEDFRIVYGSPSTRHVLGYELSEFVGRSLLELIHPDDREFVESRLREAVCRPQAGIDVRARVLHGDGSWRFVEAVFTNLLADPSVGAIVSNYHDITGHQQTEQQFFQAQKMDAVGRLAGGVAHDFNNLLAIILGFVELAARNRDDGRLLEERLDQIRRAAQKAASLTRQLLAFSRQQVLQPRTLNLNSVVAEMDKMLRRVIGEDIRLLTVTDERLGHVRVDPGQFEQVLMNLVVNARDAMPTGGELTIETANVDLDDQYAAQHVGARPGRYVMLAVSDAGVGMDAETRARIFEPFFTTKEQGKGTGLGLATVYGIVKQSGGYIWVYSEPNLGTTFKIYLPRVDARAAEAGAGVDRGGPLPRGSETILLVEDEEGVREVTAEILSDLGYKVLTFASGAQAVKAAARYQGAIGVLLTDVVMPDMSGQQLWNELRAGRPETRVLFMSGYADEAIGQRGLLPPETSFLQKPFTTTALAHKLRELLGGEHSLPS
jgi:PAS domain S-box-containing protein